VAAACLYVVHVVDSCCVVVLLARICGFQIDGTKPDAAAIRDFCSMPDCQAVSVFMLSANDTVANKAQPS
jgi:hypothetical protein